MPRNPQSPLTPEQRALMSEIGKLGNKARNAKLSKARRIEIATLAVKAREKKRREAKRKAKQQTK